MKPTYKEENYVTNKLEETSSKLTGSEMRTFIQLCFSELEGKNLETLVRDLKVLFKI